MSKRFRWIAVVAVVAGFVVSGITLMLLASGGVLDEVPWEAIGTALGIFGAISGLVVGIAEANLGSHKSKRDAQPH